MNFLHFFLLFPCFCCCCSCCCHAYNNPTPTSIIPIFLTLPFNKCNQFIKWSTISLSVVMLNVNYKQQQTLNFLLHTKMCQMTQLYICGSSHQTLYNCFHIILLFYPLSYSSDILMDRYSYSVCSSFPFLSSFLQVLSHLVSSYDWSVFEGAWGGREREEDY